MTIKHHASVTHSNNPAYDVSATAWTADHDITGGNIVTTAQRAALDAANAPSGTNAVATMADVGGGGTVLTATVTLTSAQIKALFTTPVQIVAAQAGKAIVPVVMVVEYVAGSTPYTDNGGNIVLYGGDITAEWLRFQGVNYWDQATDQVVVDPPTYGPGLASNIKGQALWIAGSAANPTLGNGTLTVYVAYVVVTL